MDLDSFSKGLNGYQRRLTNTVLEAIEKNQEAILNHAQEGPWNSYFDLGCLGMDTGDLATINGYLSQYLLSVSLEKRYVYGCIEYHTLLHW